MLIRKATNKSFFLILLLIVLVLMVIVALTNGTVQTSFGDLFSFLFNANEIDEMKKIIFSKIRFPRILLGIGAGSALALAGVLVQGLFRNPLVEPYTLGISGGATLGIATAVLIGNLGFVSSFSFPIFAFIGASIVSLTVWLSSVRTTRLATTRILLTGVMISFISSSALALIFSFVNSDELHTIIFWTLGSLEQDAGVMGFVLPIVSVIMLFVSLVGSRILNALAFGEEEAAHLGVNVTAVRFLILVIASLLTALAVSLVGVIGFVGLVVPHIMRLFVGRDHLFLIPAAWLGGAVFLIGSDIVARTIATPIIIPVGAVTGLVGGVVFIILLNTTGKDYV